MTFVIALDGGHPYKMGRETQNLSGLHLPFFKSLHADVVV